MVATRNRARWIGHAALAAFAVSMVLPWMDGLGVGVALLAAQIVLKGGPAYAPMMACVFGTFANVGFIANYIVFLARSLTGTRGRAPVAFASSALCAAAAAASALISFGSFPVTAAAIVWVSASALLAVGSWRLQVPRGDDAVRGFPVLGIPSPLQADAGRASDP